MTINKPFTTIESRKNKKIKEFLKLVESKKARSQRNLCVLEGFRLVLDAFQFGVCFKQLLISELMFNKLKLEQSPLLKFNQLNIISEKIAKEISSVAANQGVFAVVEKPENHKFSLIESNQNVLILVELGNPGNIGTLIRSAVAFNFKTVILAGCCDVYNAKVIRSSMSALFKAKILECSVSELKNWLKQTSVTTIAAVLNANGPKKISNHKTGHALLIGNEANGLSTEIVNLCKIQVTITMQNEIESLNASVAGSVLMFALSKEINF